MKTILLTSAGTKVIDEILKIIPRPPKNIKIAYIFTAANWRGYKNKKGRDIPALEKFGFKIFYYDIEGKNPQQIKNFLKSKDIIWVRGGNSFYLLKYIRQSGFDEVVKDLIEKGKIYIGVSAGAYIVCPTIEMANWKHQDRNVVGLKDLSAMNLVPFLVSVHYKPEFKEAIKEGAKKSKYPVKVLTDDQAILVQNDKIKLVGKGKEIIIN